MQSAYYLHINQAVDHERAAAQPNAALSQEEDSVIIIHQCYDVVIDYNIFLLPWGTPTANPASGLDFCTPPFPFSENSPLLPSYSVFSSPPYINICSFSAFLKFPAC